MKKISISKILAREKKWEPYSVNLNLFSSLDSEIDEFFLDKKVTSLHMDLYLKTSEENQAVYKQLYEENRYQSLVDTVTLPCLFEEVTDEELILTYLTIAAALIAPNGTVYIPNNGKLNGKLIGQVFLNADTIGTKTIRLTRCRRPRKFDLDERLLSKGQQDLGIPDSDIPFVKKPQLLSQQIEAFQFWHATGRRCLWALDMGLGKSFAQRYILYKNMFSGTYKNVMVITLSSVIPAWKHEMDRFAIPYHQWSAKSHSNNMKPGVINLQAIEGFTLKVAPKRSSFPEGTEGDLKYKKALRTWKNVPMIKKLIKPMWPGMFDLVIVDESHKLNSHKNIATKILNKVIDDNTHVLFSTGTPFSNGFHEAFSQINLLKPGALGPNWTWFKNNLCENVSKNSSFEKLQLRSHLRSKVQQIIYSLAIFKKIADGVTLPPLTITDVTYELTSEQIHFYEEVLSKYVLPISNDYFNKGFPVTSPSRATRILRTICSGFISFDFEFPGLPMAIPVEHTFKQNPKMDAFLGIIKAIKDNRALVWIDSVRTGELVTERLRKEGYTCDLINGNVSKAARSKIIEKFRSNKIQIIVAHPKTLGTGLDLLEATYQIFYELSYSLTEYAQAQKRSHRIGQKKPVIIYRLVGRGGRCIEKAIAFALGKKLSVETYLFENYYQEFNPPQFNINEENQ